MSDWRRFAAIAWLLAVVAGCGGPAEAPATVRSVQVTDEAASRRALQRLLLLMRQRLLLMHDVARWKWNENRPVEDREREQVFLDQVATRASQQQLDPGFVRQFFAAQIEASKLVQNADLARWRAEGQQRFTDVPDLVTVQRPRIDALNGDLLEALAEAAPYLKEKGRSREGRVLAEEVLIGDGISSAVREAAVAPLW